MISRREFAGKIAYCATGLAIASTARSYAQIMGSNDRVNFAIIGVHGRGYAHLSALKANEKTARLMRSIKEDRPLGAQLIGCDPEIMGRAAERIEALGRISEVPDGLTRFFCSPAMRRANDLVARWMRQAGMAVREDAIGNLIGHYPGDGAPSARRPEERVLWLGSHLDTVRNAGKFDGPLGVMLSIACIEHLKRTRARLPFGIEVVGFADEEGVRYQSAYLGSRVAAGI